MSAVQPALSCLVFLLLVAHARKAATASTLEDTCKRFAGGDQAGHGYEYCVKTLGADDPASEGADALGLPAVAVNVARSAARATAARIAMLQLTDTAPARRDCLDRCAAEYDVTARRLVQAARDVRGRGGGALREARTMLEKALGTPRRCDGAFAEAGQRSPLSTADRRLDEAVRLALGVLPTPPPATT